LISAHLKHCQHFSALAFLLSHRDAFPHLTASDVLPRVLLLRGRQVLLLRGRPGLRTYVKGHNYSAFFYVPYKHQVS